MPDANYSVSGMAKAEAGGSVSGILMEQNFGVDPTVNSVRINTKQTNTFIDVTHIFVSIIR
jgi:hypothetical protein